MSISTSYLGNERITTTTDMVSGMVLSVERVMLPECTDKKCIAFRMKLSSPWEPEPECSFNSGGSHWHELDGGDMSCYE